MLRDLKSKKYFNRIMVMIVVVAVFFILGIVMLRYSVEGETNMPFELSKISIISSSEGIDKEAINTKWAFDVYQSNDVFLYIDKNNEYYKTEAIRSVSIENIQIDGKQKDKIKIYEPDGQEEKLIFKNIEENIAENIEYAGSTESNMKQLKISNQGGLVAFRISIDNLVTYESNEEEIKHEELLKKAGIKLEDLEMKVGFDLTISLENGKEYKTTINLDFPVGNVVENGTSSIEITDVKDFIFKRI